MKRHVLAGVLATFFSACGGDDASDPAEACRQLVDITCAKMFECFTEAERQAAGLPSSEGACITQFEEQAGCANQTVDNVCEGSEVYQPDQASDCLRQYGDLECSQVRDGLEGDAPACEEICQVE